MGHAGGGGDVQMVCLDALGAAVNGDVAGLLDDHGEEELERLRCDGRVSTGYGRGGRGRACTGGKGETKRRQTRTDDDGSGLRDLADLLVLLHDALDARLAGGGRARSRAKAVGGSRGRSPACARQSMGQP